jgi:pyruvate/2-oxoglutarate dehydrogenase complex dihydrolipoamide acyltransferase (E2) component
MSYNLGQIDPDERTGLYVDPRDEEPAAPPRQVLRILGALLVMGVFAGGLWFAYFEGARHMAGSSDSGAIPLIRADAQPIKVKPAEPGGMHVPDRNMLIYGDGQGRPEVEHLLPPPEQPMALPVAPPPGPPATPAPQTAAASAPAAPAAAAAAPAAALEAGTGRPAQSTVASPANPRLARPQAQQAGPQPGRPQLEPAGGLRLQLGAVRSAGMARAEWDRLKRTNPDLLGHLTAVAVRADLGDRGVYYRIQTGPIADSAVAERLCGELRQRHLGCMIVR